MFPACAFVSSLVGYYSGYFVRGSSIGKRECLSLEFCKESVNGIALLWKCKSCHRIFTLREVKSRIDLEELAEKGLHESN